MKSGLVAQKAGLVMADTCIWIASEKDTAVAALLREMTLLDRLVMCGVVYAEVLRGLQDAAVLERRIKQLLALQWVDAPPEVWQKTAELARTQDRLGHPVPLTDVHVAALCVDNEVALWTTDRHFDPFTTLHRFGK